VSARELALERVVSAAQQIAADALGGAIDNVAEAVAAAIVREFPELSADPETTEDIRRRSRPILLVYVAGVRSGSPPDEIETPAEWLGFVRALARRGVPLSVVLRVHGVGLRVVLACWMRRLGECGLSEDELLVTTRRFVRHAFAFHDAQNVRVSAAYREARDEWIHSAQATRRTTIADILAGKPVDLESAERTLHYDLRCHHLALVLWSRTTKVNESALPQLDDAANEIAERLGVERSLTLAEGPGMLSAWVGSERQFVRDAASVAGSVRAPGIWVAVGEPAFGVKGFRASHEEAMLAARVARLGNRPAGMATRFRDVALAAAVADDLDRARAFVAEQLGPLATDSDDAARLRLTLQTFREENGSRIATASRLGVHPNTVANRVRACRETLDSASESVSGQLELDIALKLAALLGPAVLEEPDQTE
jgi:hypothetical protein